MSKLKGKIITSCLNALALYQHLTFTYISSGGQGEDERGGGRGGEDESSQLNQERSGN